MSVDFNTIRQYNFPTVIRFGAGASAELPAYLKHHGLQRPLLVTDPMVAALPLFQAIEKQLHDAGISFAVFSDIHRNPVKQDVLGGKAAYTAYHRDCIVGIGGGAALDVARAVALSINHHRDLFDYDDLLGGDVLVTEPIPHFITIPTTSGTGSEVGRSAIISEDDTKRKRILFAPSLMAKVVFADPLLTMDLPPAVTAATGMDAFTHNLEALIAKGFHPMAEGIALQAIRMIAENIEAATHQPNLTNRAQMMLASLMGAVAFQKGLGVVHSLAHPLSSLLDTHHGLANAICLPYGMRFNFDACLQKFADVGYAVNRQFTDGEAVFGYLQGLNRRLNLPVTLAAIGVIDEHLPVLAGLAVEDFCHPANPLPVTLSDFDMLYGQALHG